VDESYGILPQQYITLVGEHMLALVQALEPFASDHEALSRAREAMPGAKGVAMQSWKEFAASTGSNVGDEDIVISLMNGKDLAAHVMTNSDHNYEEDEDELRGEEDNDETDKAVTAFCNEWLDVVGSAVTGRLLERILRIHHLSPKGCEHLAVDLGYLLNVFSALGVAGHPHPLLNHFAELARMGAGDLKEMISASRGEKDNAAVGVMRAAEVRFALIRGVH